tara:strand:- start:3919 stop:4506 length:588 start_codon:yes stop_codon:yes gene_type:complete
MAERNFVIIGHRAHTAADWKLNDICGGAGRMDILARCVTSALCESHGIRKDTDVWLVLKGPPNNPLSIHFSGKNIKYLNPDERSTAALIRNALIKSKKIEEKIETSPGIIVHFKDLPEILDFLPQPIVLLSEDGKDKFPTLPSTFILGDDRDLNDSEISSLKKHVNLSLGKKSLLTSSCIILLHSNYDLSDSTQS